MDGRTEIRAKLLATSAVTDLVGVYATLPAIFDAPLTPQQYDGAAISMYQTAPVIVGQPLRQVQNTVNCWAGSYSKAEEIQDAVATALSRNTKDGVYFVCTKQQVIPPQDSAGTDYNAPVEVLTKKAIGG